LKRVLILFAHPALEKSRVNRHLARAVRDLDGVTFRDLYELYPEFDVDVEREQTLLEEHDVIVLQHPFYWYSTPALIKEWEDLVLEYGWAYGEGGTALEGKRLMCAISAGGDEAAYCSEGYNRFTIRQLLTPLEQTARLCGMEFVPPFVVHGTHALGEREILVCAEEYRRVVAALRDERLDPRALRGLQRINRDLAALLPEQEA
jgi:glutathione-regulated potassium-efflux system ancillary protein KefG